MRAPLSGILVVGALLIICLVVLLTLPAIFLLPQLAYYYVFPYHSAETTVDDLGMTVRLEFFLVNGGDGVTDETNSGRYFTVQGAMGRITQKMCGYDWAHHARTGIYLAGGADLAVVGTDTCDYLVRPKQGLVERARQMPSEHWKYLGAFDFGYDIVAARPGRARSGNINTLRFVPAAEQGECIEEQTTGQRFRVGGVRMEARKERCRGAPERLVP